MRYKIFCAGSAPAWEPGLTSSSLRYSVDALRALIFLPAIAVLSACTVGPDYQPPTVASPGHWLEPQPSAADLKGQNHTLALWWRGFKDPHLDRLIERALQGNLDLQAADARLAASRSLIQTTSAARWPSLNSSGGFQRERLSPNAFKGILGGFLDGGQSTGLLSSLGPIGTPFNLFQAGFDSTWELDLFGGIKRQQEAALANSAAASESLNDIRISLAAEVARTYVELIALNQKLTIAQERLDNQRKLSTLADNLYQEGFATVLDAQRAKTELEAVESAIPATKTQIKNTRHGLALLLGLAPGAVDRELANLAAAIPEPPTLPAGTPGDLLRRRPDIRKAERTVASAQAMVGAAVAELFPKLALTGAVGLQSQTFGDFPSLSSGFYGFGPRFSVPLFQAGRVLANIDVQESRTSEALKAYEKTVLNAFKEVEDALALLNGEFDRKNSLANAEASARKSCETALAFYAEGEAELQPALDANRSWYDLREQLLQSQLAWAEGHIALFKALGGGWDFGG